MYQYIRCLHEIDIQNTAIWLGEKIVQTLIWNIDLESIWLCKASASDLCIKYTIFLLCKFSFTVVCVYML